MKIRRQRVESGTGLASQYVSDANWPYMESMLKALLGIPEPLQIYHLVPIGYARSAVTSPPRRDELIHSERYDMSKFSSEDQLMGLVKTKSLQGTYARSGGAEGDEDEKD